MLTTRSAVTAGRGQLGGVLATSAPLVLALAAARLDSLLSSAPAQQAVAGVVVGVAVLTGRLTAGLTTRPGRRGLGNPALVDPALVDSGVAGADGAGRVLTTVLFTDIVGSTATAAGLGDSAWRAVLDHHDVLVRERLRRHGGRVVVGTGDGVLATFDSPARGVRCALAIADAVREIGLEVRAGLHTTEVERRGDDVAGLGVHIGARVAALAGPGEVLVSRTVTEVVAGAGLAFEARGTHELRGVPGHWVLFAARPGTTPTDRPPTLRAAAIG